MLGICYGMQLMTDVLGGEVRRSGHREFGHALVSVSRRPAPTPALFADVPAELRVWASHGDDVAAVPPGFAVAATSATAPIVAMEAPERALYGLLFHPEVAHTDHGLEILRNFAYDVCGCTRRLDDRVVHRGGDRADPAAGRRAARSSAGCPAAWTRPSRRC